MLADDGSEQVARARALLGEGDLLITSTVLLETEWVLRGRYQYSRNQIADLFDGLLRIANVSFAETSTVRTALAFHRQGLDFADALHLSLSSDCSAFLTFERLLEKHASAHDLKPPVRLS